MRPDSTDAPTASEGAGRPPILRTRGVSVHLGGAPVLRDVDLAVGSGTWVSVIGPNGAGKSTFLRVLAGLVGYTGSAQISGVEVSELPGRARARTMAVVPQMPTVPVGMKVGEYVLLGRTPHLSPLQREGQADHAVVRRVLAQLELARFADRPLTTMSGGELQRVFLARALTQEPAVLLLDEPTTALDIGHQQDVLDLVERLRDASGITVVATMHDLTLAGQYSDRLVLLDAGRVVADGVPEQVLTVETLSRVYRARVRVLDVDRSVRSGGRAVVPVRAKRPRGT